MMGLFSLLMLVLPVQGQGHATCPVNYPLLGEAQSIANISTILSRHDLFCPKTASKDVNNHTNKEYRNSLSVNKTQQSKVISGKRNTSDPKIILFWTHFFGSWDYEFGLGRQPFIDSNCKVSNCITTKDPSLLTQASAVVYHMRNVNHQTKYPSVRFPNQSYIFYLQESPYKQWNTLDQFNGFFNLTMTYRLDSDIPLLYGNIQSGASNSLDSAVTMELIGRKTKLVAWFVSNCGPTHSRREEYIKELQKYIPVDIYGKCGPLKCPDARVSLNEARRNQHCYEMLERDYKFYISFENIVCKDYVTEKLFNIMKRYVIPIVYGGANYTRVAPPHSVIDILDFDSPQKLAEYILQLDDSDEEYVEYFAWKSNSHAIGEEEARKEAFCALCETLHKDREGQVYDHLDAWWDKQGSCDLNMPAKLSKTYKQDP